MPRILIAVLCIVAFALSAQAQDRGKEKGKEKEKPKPKVEWLRDRKGLESLRGGGAESKPVILLIMPRKEDFKKLEKNVFSHPKVVEISKSYTCVLVLDDGGMMYRGLMMMGFSSFENKLTVIDTKKLSEAEGGDSNDPRNRGRMAKVMKDAQLWQTPAKRLTAAALTKALTTIDKKLNPKKKVDPKKDPKKDPKAAKKDDPKNSMGGKKKPVVDRTSKLFAKGQEQEKAGKLYEAYKTYKQAAKDVESQAGRKAGDAIKRLTGDPKKQAIIDQQKADEAAARQLSLGKSFLRNKKYELAASYFKRVINEHPKSKHVDEAKQLLKEAEAAQEEE